MPGDPSRNIPGHNSNISGWEAEQKRAQARALLKEEGRTIAEIATRTGYSYRQIERIARAMGLPRRSNRFTEEEEEKIRELGRQGVSATEIAWRVSGVIRCGTTMSVLRILDKAGIKRRRKGEIWPGDQRFGKACRGNVKGMGK